VYRALKANVMAPSDSYTALNVVLLTLHNTKAMKAKQVQLKSKKTGVVKVD
jgi:hypothetical protein